MSLRDAVQKLLDIAFDLRQFGLQAASSALHRRKAVAPEVFEHGPRG
ncbi:MAG: hypothetical protein WA970_03550 [Gammaproteobacteria bacterium]